MTIIAAAYEYVNKSNSTKKNNNGRNQIKMNYKIWVKFLSSSSGVVSLALSNLISIGCMGHLFYYYVNFLVSTALLLTPRILLK